MPVPVAGGMEKNEKGRRFLQRRPFYVEISV
jgi:hypothetical protein